MWKQTKTSRSWVLDGEKRRWPNACVYEIPPATLQLSSLWWSKFWDTKYRNSTHSLGCSPAPRMPHPHEPEKPLANKSQGNLHKTHTIHPCIYIYMVNIPVVVWGKLSTCFQEYTSTTLNWEKMGDRRQKHRFFLWFPDRSAILGSWVEKLLNWHTWLWRTWANFLRLAFYPIDVGFEEVAAWWCADFWTMNSNRL